MRVRMVARLAGPERTIEPGAVVDLPEELARALVEGGFAEVVEAPDLAIRREQPPEVETAEGRPAAEEAVSRRGRKSVHKRKA